MYGVVLWKDVEGSRAVIWCEDHGDLAFLATDEGVHGGATLDAGDLIHFEVTWDGNTRLANNPKLVVSEAYPTLPMELCALFKSGSDNAEPSAANTHTNVVTFPTPQKHVLSRPDAVVPTVAGRKVV